jgi:macrolide transport system ATP-binding/permease protein
VAIGENINLYFGSRCIFQKASFEIPRGKKTALVGANGSGKTTLANMLAGGGQGVKLAPGTKIGYFSQDLTVNLDYRVTVLENAVRNSSLAEPALRTVLARLLFRSNDLSKLASYLSGGERVKLSLAGVLTGSANFIILDEPTNYLDLLSMEALESVLRNHGGTMLIISHDRKFLNNVSDRLLIIEECAIKTYEGNLSEYFKEAGATPAEKEKETAIMMLQLKLSEIAGKISNRKDEVERVRLDREYTQLVKEMLALNSGITGD